MSTPSTRNNLLPLVQSFCVCRDIVEDVRRGEFILIGPRCTVIAPHFPYLLQTALYAHLANGHGSYYLSFELRDSQDDVRWNWKVDKPLEMYSPLRPQQLTFFDVVIPVEEPGRYDLVLLVNEQAVSHHALVIT